VLGRRCLRSSIKSSVNCEIGQRKSIRGCVGRWGVGENQVEVALIHLADGIVSVSATDVRDSGEESRRFDGLNRVGKWGRWTRGSRA
jgi:hypothetical protein